MRFPAPTMALAAWLLLSTLALPQTGASFVVAWAAGLLAAGIAVGSPRRTNPRLLVAVLGLALAASSILLPGVAAGARLSNGLSGALLLLLAALQAPQGKVAGAKA
jgi:hypothetical protein